MKITDGALSPREVLDGVLDNGGAARLLRGEVLTRSAAGSRWTKRSRKDLYRARQRRAHKLRQREEGMPKITILSEPYDHSIRRANLYAAVRVLGIRQPIELYTTTRQREHGSADSSAGHSVRDGTHVIRLDDRSDATARDLSDSLWHELCHAFQAEQDPDFHKHYRAESAERGYRANRYEIEANALRDDLAPGLPLCR